MFSMTYSRPENQFKAPLAARGAACVAQLFPFDFEGPGTRVAARDDRCPLDRQLRVLRQRAVAEVIEVVLDPFVLEVGQCPDAQVNAHDLADLLPTGVLEHDIQDALGDLQLVHRTMFSQSGWLSTAVRDYGRRMRRISPGGTVDKREPHPSRRSQKKGPPQGERKLSFENNNRTARPEEPPSSGGVSKGARWRKSTVSRREREPFGCATALANSCT